MTGFGTATQKISAARAALTPFGESSNAIASYGSTPSASIAVRGDDVRPPLGTADALEVFRDPTVGAGGNDRDRETEPVRLVEVRLDARPQRLEREQLELARLPRGRDRLAVDRLVEKLVELVQLVRSPDRPDPQRESLLRQLDAVLLEDLPPRTQVDRLRVDERAVEVEEKGPDHGSIVE